MDDYDVWKIEACNTRVVNREGHELLNEWKKNKSLVVCETKRKGTMLQIWLKVDDLRELTIISMGARACII